ncbi:hypothetical protein [Gorillibacterium sp. CAU 1737]|uniref:hypothetical protein n=1 Tax=Gorillibacterium sp. CAU 1737 TaxID=3140362 RepID=UPI0032614B5C
MKKRTLAVFSFLCLALVSCNAASPRSETGRPFSSVSASPPPMEVTRKVPENEREKAPFQGNAVFALGENVFFYDQAKNKVSAVGPDEPKGKPVVSPDRSRVAVPLLAPLPNTPAPLLIYDREMKLLTELDMTKTEKREFWTVAEVRWLSNDKLLIGLDYNLYVRGYYIYDLSRQAFLNEFPVLTKVGEDVLVPLDETGTRFLLQAGNERYFNQKQPAEVILDNQTIYRADDDETVVGGIRVDTGSGRFVFPIQEKKGNRLFIGAYDSQGWIADRTSILDLNIPANEVVMDDAYDFGTDLGYVLTQTELGERKLYQARLKEQKTIPLAVLGDEIPNGRLKLGADGLSLLAEDGCRFVLQPSSGEKGAFHEAPPSASDEQAEAFLRKRLGEDVPQASQSEPFHSIEFLR